MILNCYWSFCVLCLSLDMAQNPLMNLGVNLIKLANVTYRWCLGYHFNDNITRHNDIDSHRFIILDSDRISYRGEFSHLVSRIITLFIKERCIWILLAIKSQTLSICYDNNGQCANHRWTAALPYPLCSVFSLQVDIFPSVWLAVSFPSLRAINGPGFQCRHNDLETWSVPVSDLSHSSNTVHTKSWYVLTKFESDFIQELSKDN